MLMLLMPGNSLPARSGYFLEPVVRILLGGAFIFSCVDGNAVLLFNY